MELLEDQAIELLKGAPHYTPTGVLGTGSFGVVLRALDSRCTPPHEVAVKLLPRGQTVLEYCTYLKREIVHAASLRHPMIVPVREVFLTPTHLGIAMEYARGGDLLAFLNELPGRRTPEDLARWLFQQLCIGLQYCHALGVANRDLKLENLLLDGGDEGRPLLKICDFGYSKHETNSSAHSAVGTTPYMAPEVVLGGCFSYNARAVDVWSAGVALYIMFSGRYPFDPATHMFAANVVAARYPPLSPELNPSPALIDLLPRLLHPDPDQRATIDEVMQHPWVTRDLPPGALDMNAAVLARHAAEDAGGGAGKEMAVAVHEMVERAKEVGRAGEALVIVPLAGR